MAEDYRNYAGTGVTHRPTDAVFINDHYYVTGGIRNVLGNYDIRTLCMDTTLTVIWEQTYNGTDSLDDISHSIKVDSIGNVYLTGRTGMSNWTTNMVTIKYDNAGNEEWVNFYDGSDGTQNDAGYDLEINNDNVYVTGYIKNGDNYNTMCYDTAGALRWQKISDFGYPSPTDMAIDGYGNVIIAAPLSYYFYTEKFSILEVSNEVISDTSDMPICKKNEIIVKFNPNTVKTGYIDDTKKIFGNLSDFVQDSTIAKMEDKLDFDLKNINAIKIFKHFTTADSLSITRLGDTIKIEEVWSTLVMVIPDTVDIVVWMDSLNSMRADIYYCEVNAIAGLTSSPNDAYFTSQRNLKSSLFPFAHINVDGAWDKETGQDFIKIGVYDTGVNWKHIDFSRDGSGSFNSSVAKNGYDYYLDLPITSSMTYPDTEDRHHGTRVAGVIGARRNNSIGVAGIAGGDGSDTSGIEIYGFKISNGIGFINLTDALDAIMEGGYLSLNGATNFGYAINVSNNSWAWKFTGPPGFSSFLTARKAFYYSWRMGVTHFAGRGNYTGGSLAENEVMFPACLYDDWIITVGANGTDGQRKVNGNGSSGLDNTYSSMNGQQQIDCIAPGTNALVQYTTDSIAGYKGFFGTSAASPHAAGVAGLILSYYNVAESDPYSNLGFNNLCSDDVDHLIEKYSSDRDVAGHDNNTGWGLLNADSIFDQIEKPRFDILHFRGDNPVSSSASLDAASTHIWVEEPTNGYYGEYIANRYSVTATFNHVLPAGFSLVDYWPLKSHSVGMRNHSYPLPQFPSYIEALSCTDTTITLRTFVYYVLQDAVTFQTINNWLVFDWSATKFPYALHIENPTAGIEESNEIDVRIFPNPTTGIVNVQTSANMELNYILVDISGKIYANGLFNSDNYSLDLSNFSSGLYFIKTFSNSYTRTFKIIKY